MWKYLRLHPFSDAFDLNFGLVIFRLRAGFDATERMNENPGSHTFMFAVICAANSVVLLTGSKVTNWFFFFFFVYVVFK